MKDLVSPGFFQGIALPVTHGLALSVWANSAPPFDNRLLDLDHPSGEPTRYLLDPLASKYVTKPQGIVPPGMLPPEEIQVRAAIIELMNAALAITKTSWLSSFFSTKRYERIAETLDETELALRHLATRTPLHIAALKRCSLYCIEGLQREYLLSFIRPDWRLTDDR